MTSIVKKNIKMEKKTGVGSIFLDLKRTKEKRNKIRKPSRENAGDCALPLTQRGAGDPRVLGLHERIGHELNDLGGEGDFSIMQPTHRCPPQN